MEAKCLLTAAQRKSRSSANNCTGPQRRRLELELKARGFNGDDEEMAVLLRGSCLNAGANMRLFYENGRLQEKKMNA